MTVIFFNWGWSTHCDVAAFHHPRHDATATARGSFMPTRTLATCSAHLTGGDDNSRGRMGVFTLVGNPATFSPMLISCFMERLSGYAQYSEYKCILNNYMSPWVSRLMQQQHSINSRYPCSASLVSGWPSWTLAWWPASLQLVWCREESWLLWAMGVQYV